MKKHERLRKRGRVLVETLRLGLGGLGFCFLPGPCFGGNHLFLQGLEFPRLSDQFVNNSIDSVRQKLEACNRLAVRFRKINLATVDGFIASHACGLKDEKARGAYRQAPDALGKSSFGARRQVIDETLCGRSKHRACGSRGLRVDGLRFVVDLAHRVRHVLVRRDWGGFGPNDLPVCLDKKATARWTTPYANDVWVNEKTALHARKPKISVTDTFRPFRRDGTAIRKEVIDYRMLREKAGFTAFGAIHGFCF